MSLNPTPKHEWTWVQTEADYLYIPESPRGQASIQLLDNGKWRWEAQAPKHVFDQDMDGWWGFARTKDEAMQDCQNYLEQWMAPPTLKQEG